MTDEANLLRLAYIEINALLDAGFETNATELVHNYRQGCHERNFQHPIFDGVARTLTEIRDLFGADEI